MKNNKIKILLISIIFIIITISFIILYNISNKKYYLELTDSDIIINLGEEYIEPGYKGYDSNNKDYTDKVIVEHNIDTNQAGVYIVVYKLKDKLLYRKVTIIDNTTKEIDLAGVTIKLNGDKEIYVKKDTSYQEMGATATDSEGNDISSKINISSPVNTNIPNTYTVTYSINASNNKSKQIERTVIVYELSYQYNQKCTTKECTINFTFTDDYYEKIIYPNGTISKNKNINYTINKNGTYKFTIYDKYNNPTTKEITIKQIANQSSSSTSKPSSSSSSKPNSSSTSKPSSSSQSKISNNLFVGDSRTVGMCKSYKLCESSEYIAEVGKGYSWFKNTAINSINTKISSKRYNIIILMGVNDVGGSESSGKNAASKYYEIVSSNAKTTWNNQNIIFVSVNPVLDGYSNAYTVAVNAFNKEMKSKISSSSISNLKYCDTNSELNITKSNASDGLHYNKTVYQQIYNTIINKCL